MRDEGATRHGRVPVRMLLRGGPGGWHYEVIDKSGDQERVELPGQDVRWHSRDGRDPEPPWWGRRLAQLAEGHRERAGWALTDRTFTELGLEADVSWFAVEDPLEWEGLVTLRDPDPARFPGKVRPFVITLEPGRGAVMPDAHLLFTTVAADVWATLEAVAEESGCPPPQARSLCGWNDHRSVRIGRSMLHASTRRGSDGVERLSEIHGTRLSGWAGNPELRLRLDGIDLLDEPADDVVALLQDLGHDVDRRGEATWLPAMGLSLRMAQEGSGLRSRFAGVGFRLPEVLASAWR